MFNKKRGVILILLLFILVISSCDAEYSRFFEGAKLKIADDPVVPDRPCTSWVDGYCSECEDVNQIRQTRTCFWLPGTSIQKSGDLRLSKGKERVLVSKLRNVRRGVEERCVDSLKCNVENCIGFSVFFLYS